MALLPRLRGAVDFVFGFGQSIYEDCALVSDSDMPPGPQPGWVTAHARVAAGSPGGLVFKGGAVQAAGAGQTYLGRAWNAFAAVVFYRTRMDGVVVPQGWQAWNAAGNV
jgi:pectinesterase